jgi:hypothetical protein
LTLNPAMVCRTASHAATVHIQTDVGIKGITREEVSAFSTDIVAWSLEFTVRVLKHLNAQFSRPKELEQLAHELSIPDA